MEATEFALECDVMGTSHEISTVFFAATDPELDVGGSVDFDFVVVFLLSPELTDYLMTAGAGAVTLDRLDASVLVAGASPLSVAQSSGSVPETFVREAGESLELYFDLSSVPITHDGISREIDFELQALAFRFSGLEAPDSLVFSAPAVDPTAPVVCVFPSDGSNRVAFEVPIR